MDSDCQGWIQTNFHPFCLHGLRWNFPHSCGAYDGLQQDFTKSVLGSTSKYTSQEFSSRVPVDSKCKSTWTTSVQKEPNQTHSCFKQQSLEMLDVFIGDDVFPLENMMRSCPGSWSEKGLPKKCRSKNSRGCLWDTGCLFPVSEVYCENQTCTDTSCIVLHGHLK